MTHRKKSLTALRPPRPADPCEVLQREDWSATRKFAFLQDWRLDLLERMAATDEAMTARDDDDRIAEELRSVLRALDLLESANPGPDAAISRSG
jgi:hypothetical protein